VNAWNRELRGDTVFAGIFQAVTDRQGITGSAAARATNGQGAG
jgi:hypothetical protein